MPPRSMVINLGIRGVTRVQDGLKRTATVADEASAAYDRQTAAMERLARAWDDLGRKQPVGGTSGGGGGNLPARIPSGPLARYQAAQSAYDADPSFDNQYRYLRAQKALERAEKTIKGPDIRDKIGDMVGTSRIGFSKNGVEFAPLVNRIIPLFGQGLMKFIGPLGLAAAALDGLSKTARASADEIRSYGRARSLSGGTAQDVAGIGALGIDPAEIPSIGANLRQRIQLDGGDPFAMRAARELGLTPKLGRNYGPTDEAGDVLKALEGLHRLQGDPTRQIRLARQLGMDPYLDQVNVSEDIWQRNRQNVARRAQQMAEGEQASRDAAASENYFRQSWQDATRPLGRIGLNIKNWWFQGLGDDLAEISRGGFRIPFTNFHIGKPGAAPGRVPTEAANAQPGANGGQSATDRNTQAIKDLTAMLEQGMHGGGERAQSALPRAMRGFALEQAVAGGKWRLGAFR